ncbi:hypothetical protein Q669_03415 [Labrenzia sp. C1B10]|nr:hypothetical protein Q669_03415 [Labrenzia sp. C1B10]ERS05252.1 hypothetical protein Q675_02510 [Labrenzia sp. C1B70]
MPVPPPWNAANSDANPALRREQESRAFRHPVIGREPDSVSS